LWCDAIGNDVNDGLTPSTPKASVQSVLNSYTPQSGEVVRIDTGIYNLSENISVKMSGTSNAPIIFVASPYGVTVNRGNTTTASYGWDVSGDYVTIMTAISTVFPSVPQKFMKVTGGYTGFYITGDKCVIRRCELSGHAQYGIFIYCNLSDNGLNPLIENCLIHSNSLSGIRIWGAKNASVKNCTSIAPKNRPADNAAIQLYYANGVSLLNNIFCSQDASYAIEGSNTSFGSSDYNVLYGRVAHWHSSEWLTLAAWQSAMNLDTNSISGDPLFVNAVGGDYHLQSKAGSYHGGLWTFDATNSPCIDMGDPSNPFADEPTWNGIVVNLGAYGNTEQASRSADSDGDGASDTLESWRLGSNPSLPETDGDGAKDGDEYLAGTSPTNSASVFRVNEVIAASAMNGFTVKWLAVPGKTYKVLYAGLPGGPWQEDLPDSQVTARAGEAVKSYTDVLASESDVRFYKVRLVLP
jgi:hypothetical protein